MELRTLLFSIAAVLLAGVTADPDDPPAQLAGYASLRDARSAAQALAGWSASQRRSWWHHTYSSRYDERRYFAQWEGNLNRTIAWNKKSGITYWQGLAVDDFSVLTWSQLSGTYLMRGINPGAVEGSASAQALSSASPTTGRCKAGAVIPADWDWRSSGIGNRVPLIRPSQGKCGSCWAQAATAALESRAMIDGVNVGPNLSEQQLLDCVNAGNGYRSQGCQGGLAEEALDYASRFFEADEGSYARARGRGCKTQAASVGGGVSLVSRPGWRRVASSAGQIKRAVYCEGPVLAYVQIDRNFAYYQGGIYPASACRAQTSKSTFNHAVVIVGYSSGIKPYWIIRNSWGSTWGQGGTADLGGYALMELTFDAVGPCGAYRYPLVPLATRKARPPVAPPPRPPPPPPGPEWVCTCSNEDVVIKQLASWDGHYTLGLQGNRNIVLSRKLATQTVVLWQSNTGVARPQAPLTLVLQQDGNLVGYEGPPGSRTPFWRSGTAGLGAGPYRLALQINQNAVLYDGNGRPLWSTASGEPSSPFYKRNWVAVASSSTGNQLSAVVGFGAWWHSADSGRTWTSDGSQRDWADVAMSGDGSVQFAAVRGGSVYFTADSFASVFGAGDDLGKRQWSSIACSNDGTQFVVADKGGSLWTATVFLSNPALPGITPVEHTAAGSRKWVSVAMSADGQSILAAADGPGPLWASSDGGSTWREVTCPGNRAWSGVAIAGGFQVAVERGGLVWSNTAPGNGWSECGTWGDLGKRNWASVAAAPSGNDIVLAAAAAGGGIWTARIVVDSSAHDYRIDPDSISEGAARTEGAQPWSSVALASDSGAITAVAPFSFWGIFRSEDSSGQIWAPPMRGIRRFVFSNVTTSTFPQPRLPLEKNEVVPGFAPVVGKFMAQVFNGSLIVPVTGSYQIFLGSVDGSRLYLNGQLVLDNSGLHPMTFVDNNFTLGAGWYKLRLETIQWKDPGAVALEWQGVGTDGRRQAISADYLSPSQI